MNYLSILGSLLCLTSTCVVAQTDSPTRSVTAGQGAVVRWPGNCQRCSFESQAWEPVNGTCYYPVDMEKKPGTYTLSRRTTGGKLESAKLTVTEKPCKLEDIKNFKKMEYVKVSPANVARHRKEMDELNPVLMAKNVEQPAVFDIPVGKPVGSMPKGVGFGDCRQFSGQPADRHTGTDYAVSAGKPVMSVGNGKVVMAANHFFSGNSVYVDHGNGLLTEYFHLKSLTVKLNQTVTKGQKIGVVGETGRTTGPHLHFGARWHGEKINPGFLLIDPSDMPEVR